MTTLSRSLSLFALVLGCLGAIACAASVLLVWSMGARLAHVNEVVFNRIDKSLASVDRRVVDAKQRIEESQISTEDIERAVREFAGKETGERLAARLEIEKRAEQLIAKLGQAEHWLALSEVSIEGVQQVMDAAGSVGVRVDPKSVVPLLQQLGSLQRQLQESTARVAEVRSRVAELSAEDGLEERIDQIAQLALHVVATLGSIDSRLATFSSNLAGVRTRSRDLEAKTLTYIIVAGVGAALLIVWMLVGQISLGRHGWRRFHHRLD